MIFSIRVRERIVRSVDLVCPRCGLDRQGTVVVPTRWAHVGSLPIIPLGEHEQAVVCDDCGRTSDLGVLDVPTTVQLATILEDAWVGALVSAVAADDRGCPDLLVERATAVLAESGFDDTAEGFTRALAALDRAEVQRRLRRLSPEMTPFGKQGFLHRVVDVVLVDGRLTDAQRHALIGIGVDLGMAAPHVNGVLAVAAVPAAA